MTTHTTQVYAMYEMCSYKSHGSLRDIVHLSNTYIE